MCGILALLILFAPVIIAGGISGWDDGFILYTISLFSGGFLCYIGRYLIGGLLVGLGLLGIVSFYLGWA